MKKQSVWPVLSCLCAAVFVGFTSVFATEIEWIGGTDNNWATGENWEGGIAPGEADIGVFDLGEGTANNVLLVNQAKIGGVKVMSGTVALGNSREWSVLFSPDANGDAFVHVEEGASLLFSNRLYSAVNGGVRLVKTGAGTLSTVSIMGNQNYYFSAIDIEGGEVAGADGFNGLARQTNFVVHADAKLNFTQYSFTSGATGVAVDTTDGGTFRFYSDAVDGVRGFGTLEGYGNYGLTMNLSKMGPYVFGGKILRRPNDNVEIVALTFAAQGTTPDDQYGFILAGTNTMLDVGKISFADGGINPLKFAPSSGTFKFFQLSSKKDAPLILQDTNGAPVTVQVDNLGSNPGSPASDAAFKYFGVEGCGNFLSAASGAWRHEAFAFTNDVFRNTGWIGASETGKMTLGDGVEGHDVDLSHVSGTKTLAGGTLTYANAADCVQPGFLENAGTVKVQGPGKLTVEGPVSGAGKYELTAPAEFSNDVEDGTWTVSAPATFAGPVANGSFTLGAATTFGGPVSGGSYTVNAPTTFADEVNGSGTFTINAETTFAGPVRGSGAFTVKAPAEFQDEVHFSSLSAKAPVFLGNLVSGEDDRVTLTAATNMHVAADGGECWLNSVGTQSPSGGEFVFSNGFFHTVYEADSYTLLDIWRPGHFTVSHPVVRIVDADVRVKTYGSNFSKMTLGPGGIFYQLDHNSRANGSVVLDGGEYRVYLRQSYGHDSIPREADDWTFLVTERGGRISDYTWRARGGGDVRPILRANLASGAADGHAPGPLVLSFHNQITLRRPFDLDGDIVLDSGYFNFGDDADAKAAYADGTFFGSGDLTLGGVCLNFGEKDSDYAPKFAADGQKIRLAGASLILGRRGGKTPQTMTFGDGESSPFVREKGAFTVLCDYKVGERMDGTGPKFYVAGAKMPVDPETGILRDPVFGGGWIEQSGGGHDFIRYGFLTQDADGLLKEDLSLYTEGVEGGANSVARLSTDNATLSVNAQVAALNLDARSLTIEEGVTLKVGKDDPDYPAVVLTRLSNGWNENIRYGNISGAGTLDFGKSEGLIVAGRASCQEGGCKIDVTITGEGGLSLGGTTPMEESDGKLSLGGTNTYAGVTRIDGLTVDAASAGAFSSGPVHIRGGNFNGGRVRFKCAATYANEWFVGGIGSYLFAAGGLEPGCLVFNADATLTGSVHVERSARFSTSPAESNATMSYSKNASGTGVFAGEISGGEVQIVATHPAGYERKPIVFAHHNTYTGGTWIAKQDLILRGEGDCGTGKVTMGTSDATLTFENDAAKVFPNVIEGKGTVVLAGSGAVSFPNGVKHESWCDIKLDVGGTAPVFAGDIPFATVTNTAEKAATITLTTDSKIDPSWQTIDPNVNLVIADGRTLDLCGGTLTVRRLTGGTVVNGEIVQTKPAQGLLLIVR